MAIRALARLTPSAARRLHRDLVAVIRRLQRTVGSHLYRIFPNKLEITARSHLRAALQDRS